MRNRVASILLCLNLALAGCSVGMAMSGKREPELGAIKKGSTRGEVEMQLGSPLDSTTKPDGSRVDIYEYEIGNEPSAGRAVGHAALDVLTLGLWEIVGTPVEGFQGEKRRLTIVYDADDIVLAINNTPVPKKKPAQQTASDEGQLEQSVSSTQVGNIQVEKQQQQGNKIKLAHAPHEENVAMVTLRSQPGDFPENDLKLVYVRYNFYDAVLNKRGSFPHDYVDNGDGTITDRVTGLMWQKEGSGREMDYLEAKEYVNHLNDLRFAGYSDWRLPTLEELASLMEPRPVQGDLHINPIFSKKQKVCWSADSNGPNSSWDLNFNHGCSGLISKELQLPFVRAVRSLP